jgi:heme-degrading monooxygenase HmoA
MLRDQKGFQDEITLVLPEGLQVVGISLWDTEGDANAYGRAAYPRVLKALESVIGGPPEIHVFEVSNSTFHKIGSRAVA